MDQSQAPGGARGERSPIASLPYRAGIRSPDPHCGERILGHFEEIFRVWDI